MAAILDCLNSTIENIMKKLCMRCVASMWLPHHLTKEHLQQLVDICTHLKNRYQDDPLFMPHVLICDEMWAYHHDRNIKLESAAWKTS